MGLERLNILEEIEYVQNGDSINYRYVFV